MNDSKRIEKQITEASDKAEKMKIEVYGFIAVMMHIVETIPWLTYDFADDGNSVTDATSRVSGGFLDLAWALHGA